MSLVDFDTVNNFLKWYDIYKGYIFLIVAVIDAFIVYGITAIDQEKAKADIYLNLHLKYGIAKVNTIKIGIALIAFLFGPGIRDSVVFASVIILFGIMIKNICLFVIMNFKR